MAKIYNQSETGLWNSSIKFCEVYFYYVDFFGTNKDIQDIYSEKAQLDLGFQGKSFFFKVIYKT